MNQREPTSTPVGVGQALPCLALLLLPLLTAARTWARPALSAPPAAIAAKHYLIALGSPPLRFEEPAPPPDLVTRPPASAPPQPASEDAAAAAGSPAVDPSTGLAASPTTSTPVAVASANPAAPATSAALVPSNEPDAAAEDDATAAEPAPVRTPAPILTDDIRPQTRPEDFLPFFQIPTPTGNADVIVPVPRTPNGTPLPPSSATYTQSPR